MHVCFGTRASIDIESTWGHIILYGRNRNIYIYIYIYIYRSKHICHHRCMRYAERQQAKQEPIWQHDLQNFPRQRAKGISSDACYGSRVWTSSRRLLAAHKRSKPQSLCQHNTRNHGNRCQVIAACLCPELPFLAGRSLSAP